MHEVVRELRRRVAAAGVRVRRLLLDRGFDTAGVVRYLQAARPRFVMPQVVHGKKPRSGILKGLRLIRATHPTGWTTYTLWAWLHWVVLSVRVPGGRRLRLKVLRLRTMARWLLHRTEQLLGWIDHTVANHPPDEPLVNKRRLQA